MQAIRTLSPGRAQTAQRVHLRGTVMVVPAWRNSFFFSDGHSGISIDRDSAAPVVHAGDHITLDGSTSAGQFAPAVNAQQVRITGHGPLPTAPLTTTDDMRNGRLDSPWIAVRGLVRSAEVQLHHGYPFLVLSIDMGAGTLIDARIVQFPPDAGTLLSGSTVRITGICGSAYNTRRQFIGPRLFITDLSSVHIEHAAAPNPFSAPITPLAELLRFNGASLPLQRVHVQGTVTLVKAGQGFYLQSTTQGVFVQGELPGSIAVGDSLQVVGYPRAGAYSPTLVNALVRPSPPQPLPAAATIQATALLSTIDAYVYAPYDALLVRIRGKLINIIPSTDQQLLLLESDGILVTASLPLAHAAAVPSLRVGSIVALTGVSSTSTNDTHEAHSTVLLLRSTDDIRVLHAAPWWTTVRTGWVVIALALLMPALLGWIVFMRRQARLHDLVIRDPLTGLYNRRGFLLLAERQWNQAVRRREHMLLFYIDLDGFKQINDTHGHKLGDTALQAVAALLRDCFRKIDILGRMGGDEFAITAIDTPDLTEDSIRERLRQALLLVNGNGVHPFQLNLSIGVLSCDRSLAGLPIEDLIARADSLMYEQKRTLRGSVGSSLPPPITPALAPPPQPLFG